MLSEQEIHKWWNWNIKNYIKKYSKRNKLTLAQEKEKKFTEMHEEFLKVVPAKIKIFLESRSWLDLITMTIGC